LAIFRERFNVEMSVKTIRDNLVDAIDRVASAGERVVLTRKSKGVAALVSMEDLAALRQWEDEADAKAARKALAEMKRKGQKPIPVTEVKKRLGMK
jgi:prevent-host-death family protein